MSGERRVSFTSMLRECYDDGTVASQRFAEGTAYFLDRMSDALNRDLRFGVSYCSPRPRKIFLLFAEDASTNHPLAPEETVVSWGAQYKERDSSEFWMRLRGRYVGLDYSLVRQVFRRANQQHLAYIDFPLGDWNALHGERPAMRVDWKGIAPSKPTIDAIVENFALFNQIHDPAIDYDRVLAPYRRDAARAIIEAARKEVHR